MARDDDDRFPDAAEDHGGHGDDDGTFGASGPREGAVGGMRLARLLAERGIASRREAERMIAAGEVVVNGEVATGVVLVDPDKDHVRIDGRPLPPRPELRYYVMYKPKGTITSREDPQGRTSVYDVLGDVGAKVEAVGRLDFDTEGALLLTNDGDLANALTHPKNKVPKRYLAKVYRTPDERDMKAIETGIFLEDGRTLPAKVRLLETTDTQNASIEVTVTEGRNRLVRRMLGKLGHPVSKLRRESFATISIRGMERGQVRALTGEEIRRLREMASGTRPQRAGRKTGEGFAKAKPKKPRHGGQGKGPPKRPLPSRGGRKG
jgi:23S rRNA pseudouridine2605 synthase